jgi:hypothetical protein
MSHLHHEVTAKWDRFAGGRDPCHLHDEVTAKWDGHRAGGRPFAGNDPSHLHDEVTAKWDGPFAGTIFHVLHGSPIATRVAGTGRRRRARRARTQRRLLRAVASRRGLSTRGITVHVGG